MELTVLKEEQDVLDINGSCRICHNGDLVVIPMTGGRYGNKNQTLLYVS
jgi:hypothetical protein